MEISELLEIAKKGNLTDCGQRKCADTIEAQQQEIAGLKEQLNDIKILKMAMENGKIDMTIKSPKAKLFLASIVQIFRQNGAKNYYAVDFSDAETNESFSVAIQNNKGLSPAQILNEKDKQITALKLDKDEQAVQIMRMNSENKKLREGLRHAKADLQVAQNFSHPNGFKTIRKAINRIDDLIGDKDDA